MWLLQYIATSKILFRFFFFFSFFVCLSILLWRFQYPASLEIFVIIFCAQSRGQSSISTSWFSFISHHVNENQFHFCIITNKRNTCSNDSKRRCFEIMCIHSLYPSPFDSSRFFFLFLSFSRYFTLFCTLSLICHG